MKKVLIISPHYPPSNLAAVHRTRLFAAHLPEFGWEPIVLTVHENFYEEKLDFNLVTLIPDGQRIEKVAAMKAHKPRIIGDIGLRGFCSLYKKAKYIIGREDIDFLYIPVPSFYVALLGRILHKNTKVKYGIDYIDPWVHYFPGSEVVLSRHWLSTKLAKFLEPIAVKNASLITGVAAGYYQGVIDRNPKLVEKCLFGSMPYGGEVNDHRKVKELGLKPYLFNANGKTKFIYAGAMLPKAYALLEAVFQQISLSKANFDSIEFHFIGTGKQANNPESYTIKALAEKYSLWNSIVFEYPKRIAYLDVLVHLDAADGVFILGSTEPHYTPSKTYQGVLSGKPIFAVLHEKSSAINVLEKTGAGKVLSISGENGPREIEQKFIDAFQAFLTFVKDFDPDKVNRTLFEEYSARSVTRSLSALLDKVVSA